MRKLCQLVDAGGLQTPPRLRGNEHVRLTRQHRPNPPQPKQTIRQSMLRVALLHVCVRSRLAAIAGTSSPALRLLSTLNNMQPVERNQHDIYPFISPHAHLKNAAKGKTIFIIGGSKGIRKVAQTSMIPFLIFASADTDFSSTTGHCHPLRPCRCRRSHHLGPQSFFSRGRQNKRAGYCTRLCCHICRSRCHRSGSSAAPFRQPPSNARRPGQQCWRILVTRQHRQQRYREVVG